jgi:predicted RecA/RadA family phage recombinase
MYGSAWVQGDIANPCQVTVRVDWLDGGGSLISTAFSVNQTVPSAWTRLTSPGIVVPVGAVTARFYLWADQRTTLAGAATVRFDAAQFELDMLSDYARATLKAGDLLGFGGQVSRVMADSAATDAGTMVAEVLPRVRSTVASGAAVTWNAPTVTFLLASGGGVPIDFMPADISGSLALQLVEA